MAKRDTLGRIRPGGSLNPGGRPRKYREYLEELIGEGGCEAFETLDKIRRGVPFVPTLSLPDGRKMSGEPMVPTVAEQGAAARDLLAYLLGKPVSQTEALSLDRKQAEETAMLEALSDEELFRKAREVLGLPPTVNVLPAKSEQVEQEIPSDIDYIDEE